MARNDIVKVNIDSECILKAMDLQKISFRELSRRIGKKGCSDRMLRNYIARGVCPPYVATRIIEVLHMHTSQVIVAPYVIADIRLCIQVTDYEYDRLASGGRAPDELIADFLQRAVPYTENDEIYQR
jgi:hypothetical protein